MATDTEIAQAVAVAMATANAENARVAAAAKAAADEKAKKIGVGTVIGALVAGLFPVISGIIGLVYLLQGKVAKGLLFWGVTAGYIFLIVLASLASNVH